MPTPTDLVTDLPADFEVFGQAVDTSMADLLGGTTGQILAKASNSNMDFAWITNDVGDITAVNVTSPITGGGSSGAVTIGINAATTSVVGAVQLSDSTSTTSSVLASTPTATKAAYDLADAAIAKSTVTTAGDIIYRNGSAPTRLGIGTAGQVLTVNSGATAPEWAAVKSGLTLVKTQTIGSAVSTVNVTDAFSATYDNYKIIVSGGVGSTDTQLALKLGATTTGYYSFQIYGQYNAATVTGQAFSNTANFPGSGVTSTASITGEFNLQNPNAAKNTHYSSGWAQSNTLGNTLNIQGYLANTTQYTDFTLTPAAGTLTGGTIRVYGYQNS
jgi:hypothetical protein